MLFDYQKYEGEDADSGKERAFYRPLIQINLLKRGFKFYPVQALIDSGADNIIFPASFADDYRIQYKKGRVLKTLVVGGSIVNLYEVSYEMHGIDIFFLDKRVREKIYFSEGEKFPLLGQDFFAHFKISFDRAKKVFDVEPY